MPVALNTINLGVIVQECVKRIRHWRVPPHWTRADWQDEVTAQAEAAAYEASREYDTSQGVPLNAFVHQRVVASVLTRYRQEWAYGRRCTSIADVDENALGNSSCSCDVHELLSFALTQLPQNDRWLIEQLFWDRYTETEIGKLLGISQQAVSKRKRAILHDLRCWLDAPEKT